MPATSPLPCEWTAFTGTFTRWIRRASIFCLCIAVPSTGIEGVRLDRRRSCRTIAPTRCPPYGMRPETGRQRVD